MEAPEHWDEAIDEKYIEKRFEELRNQRDALKRIKPLATSIKLSMYDLEYALRKHDGNLLKTAEFLGIRRSVLRRKVDNNPHLQRLVQELEESVKDEAEHQLITQVREGYFPAISMFLRTKGKDRGYTERVDAEYDIGPNATRTAAALIEAMRRGAAPVVEVESYRLLETTKEES